MTLTNEYFAAQVVSLHLKETLAGPTKIRIEPKPGEWDKALSTIWPVKESTVNWPQNFSETVDRVDTPIRLPSGPLASRG